MTLTAEIMNIPCRLKDSDFVSATDRLNYKTGHRDARHAACDIAQAYEQRIEKLESALQKIADTRIGGCLCTMRESCSVCDSFSPVAKLCEIAKEALK